MHTLISLPREKVMTALSTVEAQRREAFYSLREENIKKYKRDGYYEVWGWGWRRKRKFIEVPPDSQLFDALLQMTPSESFDLTHSQKRWLKAHDLLEFLKSADGPTINVSQEDFAVFKEAY